jgi:hypothetical protein
MFLCPRGLFIGGHLNHHIGSLGSCPRGCQWKAYHANETPPQIRHDQAQQTASLRLWYKSPFLPRRFDDKRQTSIASDDASMMPSFA